MSSTNSFTIRREIKQKGKTVWEKMNGCDKKKDGKKRMNYKKML